MKTLRQILENFKQDSDCYFKDQFYNYLDTPLDEIEESRLAECIYDDLSYEFLSSSDAMEYLLAHDTSLTESIEKATSEFGYEAKDLNSCILASILRRDDFLDEALEDLERLMALINKEVAGE